MINLINEVLSDKVIEEQVETLVGEDNKSSFDYGFHHGLFYARNLLLESAKKQIHTGDEIPRELEHSDGVITVNVIAKVEGYAEPQIMCCLWECDDNDMWGWCWCNCYGNINGKGEYDDNYNVLEWQYLPTFGGVE